MRVPLLGRKTFQGGAYLPMDAGAVDGPVRDLPTPRRLIVPLTHGDGPAACPVVEPGQIVAAGTPIGRCANGLGPGVHAPLAGQVTAIARVDTAHAANVPAIEIATSEAPIQPRPRENGHLARLATSETAPTPKELAELADRAGVIDLGGRLPAALGDVIREAADLHLSHLIINALQPEPMLTANLHVLRDELQAILAASIALQASLGIKRAWLAVDDADRAFVRHCRSAVLGTPIRILPLANKYPQAAAPLLAWTVTGRETPYGRRTIHSGVLVLGAVTLADLWPAIQDGSPVVSRVITVSGPAALRPGHYRIPVGTTYGEVIEHVGLRAPLARLIDGGPLTGRSVESPMAVVTKATMAILLIDHAGDHIPNPGPCIRCGQCQQDCPVGLDPQRLLDAYERSRPEEAARQYPHACVECGLCSYVCPAELPLAQAAAALKAVCGRCNVG